MTQFQVAILALLAAGLIAIVVVLLLVASGDSNDDQAAAQTPTPTAVGPVTTTVEAQATSSATTASAAATEAPSATTAPPAAATATSAPAPSATSTTAPTPTPTSTPTPTPTATVVSGVWSGSWETNCSGAVCGGMELLQTGNTVVGTYAGGQGTINGTVTGNHLTGTWSRNATSGSIDFWISASGQRWQGSYDGYYAWCGRRTGGSYPSPCGLSSWAGTWTTNCGLAICGNMTLLQDGADVTGIYGGGSGTITATVNGSTLTGTWMRNASSGNFTFDMQINGDQFKGHFGVSSAWCGYRNAAGDPSPCNN